MVLAASYGFISPYFKDFKRDVVSVSADYELKLYAFLQKVSIQKCFGPLFELYNYSEKIDFDFPANPLLFVLTFFNYSGGPRIASSNLKNV